MPSWGHENLDLPPKVAILVKGAPGGTIIRDLRQSDHLKPWMHVQTQVNGSYRSADMVEALDWVLPSASNSTESIIVMLDWYSGHLTDEVANLVKSKGHVLVFHGGGCTPFTQINDTHLHARLSELLIQIENQWAMTERHRLVSDGQNKTPKMTRDVMLSIVQEAWLSIDHARVAAKGYKQTGPALPLRGPIAPEDVYHDLLRVLEELEPSSSPLEVGMTLRDEAIAMVKKGHAAGKWTVWADCYTLIEDQDGVGEALEEGLEAYSAEVEEDGEAGDDDDDDDDDEDDDEAGGGPSGFSSKPDDVDGGLGDDHHGVADTSSDIVPIDGAGAAQSSSTGDESVAAAAEAEARQVRVAQARQVLYDEAVRTKDDVMLKQLRAKMRGETQKQKDARTDTGMMLRKRAQEHQEADAKRRREAREEERLAAKDLEATKAITARAQQAVMKARLAVMEQAIVNRRDTAKRKRESEVERAFQRWLQTQYPVTLACKCYAALRGMSKANKAAYEEEIKRLFKEKTFDRQMLIKDLWVSDKTFTLDWSTQIPLGGGAPRAVRCGVAFQQVINETYPESHFGHDPVEALYRIFQRCVPRARDVFDGTHSALRLLHVNDYVMEKAFVWGIVALSKWLSKDRFPAGVYGEWPPKTPKDLVPKYRGSESVTIDKTAEIEVSVTSGVLGKGSTAASSSSASSHCKGSAAASSGSSVFTKH